VMDERYVLASVRYIELNPVRARLVKDPAAYPWSSAKAHIEGRDDTLVSVSPLAEMIPAWREFLGEPIESSEEYRRLRQHERTGRPLEGALFINKLEELLRRKLRRRKPGPKGPWKHRTMNN
jgi:putative transposase